MLTILFIKLVWGRGDGKNEQMDFAFKINIKRKRGCLMLCAV
jgi:hypothetical protein